MNIESDSNAPSEGEDRPGAKRAQDAQVYIVDDDASVRRALSRVLRTWGLDVRSFSSAEQFIETSVDDTRACVVADVLMAGQSGAQLPEMLSQRGRKLPVILMTAQDSDSTRERAREVGACAFFRKPVDAQALVDSIRWALGNRKKEAL